MGRVMTKSLSALKSRKGPRNLASIDPEVLPYLNQGILETKNLMEALALDQRVLAREVFDIDVDDEIQSLGITRRISAVAETLLKAQGDRWVKKAISHPSDTVRGWACYGLGLRCTDLQTGLEKIRPLATDSHFGVREWAWLVLRPHVVEAPEKALELLKPWTTSSCSLTRRFAAEITRPRGVWCAHISLFKEKPETARSFLETYQGEMEKYAQDSVANWLNDAAKTQPEWVRGITKSWEPNASSYMIRRARRSL